MNKKTAIFLILIILVSLLINGFFYYISDFHPLLSDTARLACSVKNILATHTLQNENFYADFAGVGNGLCYVGATYVPIRLLSSVPAAIFPGLSAWVSMYVFFLAILATIPILIFFIARLLVDNNKIALFSAFFGVVAPFFARSALVHPQNLVGFCLYLLFILVFCRYVLKKQKKDLAIMLLVLAIFIFFHHLSFFVLALSLGMYFFLDLPKRKFFKYFFGAIVAIVILYLLGLRAPVESFLNTFGAGFEGGALWDSSVRKLFLEIPSYVGYLLFVLGMWGVFQYFSSGPDVTSGESRNIESYSRLCSNNKIFRFFLSLIIAPAIFSQLYLLGFNFFSFRIIAFIGIPLVIFSGLGLDRAMELLKKFKLRRLAPYFIVLIFVVMTTSYFAYQYSIYKARNVEFLPERSFLNAIEWLNVHSTNKTIILATAEKANKQTAALSYLYKGNVVYYPASYFSNPKKMKFYDESARNRLDPTYFSGAPSHWLARQIQKIGYFKKLRLDTVNQKEKNLSKLRKLNQLILFPDLIKTNTYENMRFDYVILLKNKWADKIFTDSKLKKVYTNDKWQIYDTK